LNIDFYIIIAYHNFIMGYCMFVMVWNFLKVILVVLRGKGDGLIKNFERSNLSVNNRSFCKDKRKQEKKFICSILFFKHSLLLIII